MRVEGRRDHRIAAIAELQRGLVSRRQLLQAGLSYSQILLQVKKGWLIPVHPGVFAVGYRAEIPLAGETAALLSVRARAWLTGESALVAWEMIPDGACAGPVQLVVGVDRAQRVAGVRVHRTRLLAPCDLRIHRQLPVIAPARALLEAAADLTDRELERAYDHLLVKRLARPSDVSEVLARMSNHRGRKRVESLVQLHTQTTITRSEAEERMLMLIRAAGLPQPLVNHRLRGYEVDFYWPRERLVVEVDGFRYHSTRQAFEHDRSRDANLRAHGISPLRITWRQLTEEPFAVVALIAQILARAETAGVDLSMN